MRVLRRFAAVLAFAFASICGAGATSSGPAAGPASTVRGYLHIEAVVAGMRADGAPQWVMYLDGEFEPGADRRLAAFVVEQGITQPQVYLNSPGGSLLAGMAVGRGLRALGAETHVGRRSDDPRRPTPGVCYSACPFAYAGGTIRELGPGSVLGIHRARNRVPVPDPAAFDDRVAADAKAYLLEMGVDPQLVPLMQSVPAGEIRVLPAPQARRFKLVDGTPAP